MIFFLFHIEIEGKCRWIIGGGQRVCWPPLSNYWGAWPPLFLRLWSSSRKQMEMECPPAVFHQHYSQDYKSRKFFFRTVLTILINYYNISNTLLIFSTSMDHVKIFLTQNILPEKNVYRENLSIRRDRPDNTVETRIRPRVNTVCPSICIF